MIQVKLHNIEIDVQKSSCNHNVVFGEINLKHGDTNRPFNFEQFPHATAFWLTKVDMVKVNCMIFPVSKNFYIWYKSNSSFRENYKFFNETSVEFEKSIIINLINRKKKYQMSTDPDVGGGYRDTYWCRQAGAPWVRSGRWPRWSTTVASPWQRAQPSPWATSPTTSPRPCGSPTPCFFSRG